VTIDYFLICVIELDAPPYMLMFVEQTISPALACLHYTRAADTTAQWRLIP
jgi:hypothetical protein